MKKSKVIIPAMAMILFSTAASISGTVAWFTASRVFSMNAGDFEIAQIEGNLDCEVTAGIGTTKTGTKAEGNQAIVVGDGAVQHRLLDGSVAHTTGVPYRLNRDTTGDSDHYKPYNANGSDWVIKQETVEGVTTKYFVAVSWTLTFSYEFHGETLPIGVYFNFNSSTMAVTNVTAAQNESTKESNLGFRIAFVPTTINDNNHALVWGKNSAYSTGNYVSGVTKTSLTAYSGNYAYPGETYEAAVDGTSATTDTANRARKERICTLTTTTNSMDVKCYAWFEGEDPNVVNDTAMDKVRATLNFYARSDSAALGS